MHFTYKNRALYTATYVMSGLVAVVLTLALSALVGLVFPQAIDALGRGGGFPAFLLICVCPAILSAVISGKATRAIATRCN